MAPERSPSLLALDFGTSTTRAFLIEETGGQYRLTGFGSGPATWADPYHDISAGVWAAVSQIELALGRMIIDPASGRLIIPTLSGGAGADMLQITISGGPRLRAAALGLTSAGSLAQAVDLVASLLGPPLDAIGTADARSLGDQLASLLAGQPNLLVIAGGYEGGAEASLIRQADLAEAVCKILPPKSRPDVLYCGNHALDARFLERLRQSTRLAVAPNILPSEGVERSNPAYDRLCRLVADNLSARLPGMEELSRRTAMTPQLAAPGQRRMLSWLARQAVTGLPATVVDLGSSQLTIHQAEIDPEASAEYGVDSFTRVYPDLGFSTGLPDLLPPERLRVLRGWLTEEIDLDHLRDVVWNRSLHPALLPLTATHLEIDQAITRELLRAGMERLRTEWPGWTMEAEPLFVSGGALAGCPTPADALLLLLDGLQPVGASTIYLDSRGILPILGTAARTNALLSVQVLENDGPACLAWVLSPLWPLTGGSIRLGVRTGGLAEERVVVKPGGFVRLPIEPGDQAEVRLLDMSPGVQVDTRLEKVPLRIQAGLCGAWVDARGRPLRGALLPVQRRAQLIAWREQLAA